MVERALLPCVFVVGIDADHATILKISNMLV
jgi:hypothetical protein